MIKIIDMYWERSNLYLVLDDNIEEPVFLIRKTEEIQLSSEGNKIVIKFTNTPEGTMLPSAVWRILLEFHDLVVDTKLLTLLEDKSRIFRYRKERYAYIVYFSVDENLHLNIDTKFMMVNTKPERFYRLSETDKLKGKISILFKRLGVYFFNVFYKFLHLFKISKNNILFLTENSNELTWNLKMFYEYMKNDKNYKIRVFASDKFSKKGRSIVDFFKETVLLAHSDFVIIDNYTPLLSHLKLSKKTKLIQLWHAGIGFKSVGYARFGIPGSPHPYISCHRRYTDAIVDQNSLIDVYQEVFGVKKEIFKDFGIPRLDGYLDSNKIKQVTEELFKINPFLKSEKVILFSPTYRGNGSSSAYYDYSLINLKNIYEFCCKNHFIFVLKMHPFITESIVIPEQYQDRIYDYSNMDINNLIYVSDVMITDYSSCAYEFSLFDRPLIFYRFDKELYEYLRPMHTVDAFTEKQFEVRSFEELMNTLEQLKDTLPSDRYQGIKKSSNANTCEQIKREIIGD